MTSIARRAAGIAAAGLLAALVTLIPADRASGATAAVVSIESFAFAPTVLTVPVGTTVTWSNHDEETHTVTAVAGTFRSSGLGTDETFSETFTQPGTYPYFCALHPHMRATVVVK
jgi:plastocyanin